MAVPPLVALKAAGSAQKALTGDMFVRTTSKVVGKGKKAQVVEHTTHINPVTVGVGLAATAVGVGLAAWIFQLKLSPTIVRTYKTVVDKPEVPAQYQWVTVNDRWIPSHDVYDAVIGSQCGADGSVLNPDKDWTAGQIRLWYSTHTPHGVTPLYGPRTIAGYWQTHKEYQETAAAIPAVTHQEETGMAKKFSIEQRQGFSSDTLFNAVGLGAPITAAKVIPKIIMDPMHVFKKWWG